MHRLAALDEKRAQGMPGDVAPESLVRGECAKQMRTSINRYNRTRRHSLRDVGRLIPCSPRSTGLDSLRRPGCFETRSLTPASGCQDHTASPDASRGASSGRTNASIATRLTFRDDRPERPSWRGGLIAI